MGGYRSPTEGKGAASPNKGWKNPGFRTYADYMLTPTFQKGIQKLINKASKKRLVLMCAEKLYWKCHRRLISDYLFSKGYKVWHIIQKDQLRKHGLTKFAQIKDGVLTYPPSSSLFNGNLF